MGDFDGRQLTIEIGDILRTRLAGDRVHLAGCFDGFRPVLFLLVDFKEELESLLFVLGSLELGEELLRAVQQSGFEIVLRKLVQRGRLLLGYQIGPIQQIFVHPDRAFHLTAATEQAAEGKVQFDGLRIDLDDLDKGFDGLVGLFVKEKIESLEIRQRQRTGFGKQLLYVDARGKPAEGEEQRKPQKPPEFEFHVSDQIPDHFAQYQHRIRVHLPVGPAWRAILFAVAGSRDAAGKCR